MVFKICVIVFMVASLVNWFILWRKYDRIDRDMYNMFINYSKELEAVKANTATNAIEVETLKQKVGELDAPFDENAPEADMVRGLQNIFNYSAGGNA